MLDQTARSRPGQRLADAVSRLRQRPRQLLVLATIVGYPGMYVGYWLFHDSVSSLAWGVISVGLIAMTIVGGSFIWAWTRNRVDLKAPLDERERLVRDRVYVRSYQVLGAIDTFIVVVLGLATAFGRPITVDFDSLVPFIVGNAIYFPALPSLIYAWTERDPLPEDA